MRSPMRRADYSAACSKAPDQRTYTLQGQVQSLDIPRKLVTVKHEEIKGFMAAMEMSYPVAPPSLLNGLNAGDKIQFTIDGGNSTITGIRVIEYIK